MNHSNGGSNDRLPQSSQPSELPTCIQTSGQRLPANSGLNPALTFDRFVVGQSNQEAYAAAKNMTNGAVKTNEALIIHGGVGLGKTHLLHAIGNKFRQGLLNRTVYCSSAEKLMREWLLSISNPRKAAALRAQYRHVDLLLIDDIQFLSPEQQIQEEFFRLLNYLNEQDQRLVCTCDRLPQFLKEFWDSPDSLTQGHIVEICAPEFDLRVSILKQKLKERESGPVPLKVLRYLAKHLTQHIRQLEGASKPINGRGTFGLAPDPPSCSSRVREQNPGSTSSAYNHARKDSGNRCSVFPPHLIRPMFSKARKAVCTPATSRDVSYPSVDDPLAERDSSRFWTKPNNSRAKLSAN